jgi:hypothetical protein
MMNEFFFETPFVRMRGAPTPRRVSRGMVGRCGSLLGCLFATVLTLLNLHCRAAAPKSVSSATHTDRLIRQYPDLRTGRFAVIADFEDAAHAELFTLSGTGAAEAVTITRQGRAETGGSCLSYVARSAQDELVINNERAMNWYLRRDWRGYELLLVSLEVASAGRGTPSRTLEGDISLVTGPPERHKTVHAPARLHPGWNLLRLDLVELADRVALDDVREVRIRAAGMSEAVVLRLDDVILASNREDLMGHSGEADGALYVQRMGRGFNIGAGGRFELGFSGGQIVRWYDLAADPYRNRNLLAGSPIGPDWSAAVGLDSAAAGGVIARMDLLEMNRVRAVVSSEWHLEVPSAGTAANAPTPWTFIVYTSGQVFVRLREPSEGIETSCHRLLTSGLSARRPVREDNVTVGNSEVPQVYTTIQWPDKGAVLLAVAKDRAPTAPSSIENDSSGRSYVPCEGMFYFAGSTWTEDALRVRAAAFLEPSTPRIEAGQVRSLRDGLPQSDTGACTLEAEDGVVRFVLDGRNRPWIDPVFLVRSESGVEQAWVYRDQKLFDSWAWTGEASLIVYVPGTLNHRALVEVYFQQPGYASRN